MFTIGVDAKRRRAIPILVVVCLSMVALDTHGQETVKLPELGSVKLTSDNELCAEAEKAMVAFANARQELPAQFAYCARAEHWMTGDRQGMVQTELFFLGVHIEVASVMDSDSPHAYFGRGSRVMQAVVARQDYSQQLGEMRWEQFVRVGEDTYNRVGAGSKYDHFARLDNDPQEGTPIFARPDADIDFFIVPLMNYDRLLDSKVQTSVIGYFLRGDVLRAARVGKKLIGVWQFRNPVGKPGGYAIVAFDDSRGGMPIRTDWLFQRPGDDLEKVLNRGKMVGAMRTEWREQETPDGKRFLPVKIQGLAATDSQTGSYKEGSWYIYWRFGKDVSAMLPRMPLTTVDPWQDQVLSVFEQDPSIPQKEFVEQFERQLR